jgi:hypothetical protein
MMEEEQHLSPSQLNMFFKCSAQWWYRYVRGFKQPPGSSLLVGSAYDAGCLGQFTERMEHERDLALPDLFGKFEEKWDAMKDEVEFTAEEDPGALKDEGVGLLGAYFNDGLLDINPISAQEPVRLLLEGMPVVMGYMDVLDKTISGLDIVDQKTTGRTPSTVSESHRLQVLTYRESKAAEGIFCGCRIDYAVKLKAPKIVKLPVVFTEDERGFILRQMARAYRNMCAIRADVNMVIPNRESNLCSPKWCGYWQMCHSDF